MDKSISKSVVNLSKRPLSEVEGLVLSRGLKFCPQTAMLDPGVCRQDLDNLHRKLRIKHHFATNDSNNDSSTQPVNNKTDNTGNNLFATKPFIHNKFKCKSKWGGSYGSVVLESYIAANERDFNCRSDYRPPRKHNISPAEEKAIDMLSKDKSIVIKPADKGSSVVIMDRGSYLDEAYRQLSDQNYYEKLDEDPTREYSKAVHDAIEDMYQNGEIDEKVREYLLSDKVRTARFYLLPKIHKNKNPPPGRPVISGIDAPTDRISKFVDHFLNPCSIRVRSYLKDTNDFLRLISKIKDLPKEALLVTMDVTALYTNIPTKEGMKAANKALCKFRPAALHPRNASLMRLLHMVLKMNNFIFNGQNYLQIGGTAIGTKAAPSFAILYMGDFEERYVYPYHLQPLVYVRYIDDIFMIWQHGEKTLQEFVRHLNTRVHTIKFTHETSEEEISFLDVLVIRKENRLITDLYTKPTDTHDYLLYSSAHDQRCKDSIPYSQFLRVKRICSEDCFFRRNVMMLTIHFLRRNYPQKLLLKAAEMALTKDRQQLLEPRQKTPNTYDEEQMFLITTFHPIDHNVRDIVFNNWDILGKNDSASHLYSKRIRMCYRRPKNLKDRLVRASIPMLEGDEKHDPTYIPPPPTGQEQIDTGPNTLRLRQTSITQYLTTQSTSDRGQNGAINTPTVPPRATTPRMRSIYPTAREHRGFTFCNKRYCPLCRRLNKSGKILCHLTDRTHNCMKKISCRSSNLIYCITCKMCGIQYVGQTMRRLRKRFYSHDRDIREEEMSKTVSRHLSKDNHNTNWNIEISVLEFIKQAPDSPGAKLARDRIECKWIHLLRTLAPGGLNLED